MSNKLPERDPAEDRIDESLLILIRSVLPLMDMGERSDFYEKVQHLGYCSYCGGEVERPYDCHCRNCE